MQLNWMLTFQVEESWTFLAWWDPQLLIPHDLMEALHHHKRMHSVPISSQNLWRKHYLAVQLDLHLWEPMHFPNRG